MVLFRNKSKIILLALLGLGGAAAAYLYLEPPYQSTAKLLVKYVMDTTAVTPDGNEGYTVRNVDSRGENVLNVEQEILTSWDLALEVAESLGPEALMGPDAGTNSVAAAAARVLGGLTVQVPRRSSVMWVTYQHPRPEMTVRVLSEVIDRYLERHVEAHRFSGSYETLQRETDMMKANLQKTQKELNDLKSSLDITTLEGTKQLIAGQMRQLEDSIIQTQAELAQQQARLELLKGSVPSSPETDALASTLPPPVGRDVLEKYRLVAERLDRHRKRELELVTLYSPEHIQVKQVRTDIEASENEKQRLEESNPGLLLVQSPTVTAGGGATPNVPDTTLDAAEVVGTQARLNAYTNQLATLKRRLTDIQNSENQVLDLERRLVQEEKAFTTSESNLQRARFDEALDPSKIPNINVVQKPSMPRQDGALRLKVAGGIAFAGFAFGLALAFLRELVFDQSIRSPLEIETKLQLPMFLSIPMLSDRQPVRFLTNGDGNASSRPSVRAERAPWEISHFIRPYCDALRDRLIMYFQLKNIHHKPKLVAITSCGEGVGTTTVAAALAASLSETGDGKVLLVDMNVSRPEMHPFFRGNLAASLSDLFQPGGQISAGQYDNLYLATGTERNGEITPLVPAKFYEMLPRMRSSDFDYIIFDMPPIKQTSATVALSGFMDKVLLLIEPGKTNREAVRRATALMRQQHADVAGVVNRLPASAMKWLQPELA